MYMLIHGIFILELLPKNDCCVTPYGKTLDTCHTKSTIDVHFCYLFVRLFLANHQPMQSTANPTYTVTLFIFSGRQNPSWTISATQYQEFVKKHADLLSDAQGICQCFGYHCLQVGSYVLNPRHSKAHVFEQDIFATAPKELSEFIGLAMQLKAEQPEAPVQLMTAFAAANVAAPYRYVVVSEKQTH